MPFAKACNSPSSISRPDRIRGSTGERERDKHVHSNLLSNSTQKPCLHNRNKYLGKYRETDSHRGKNIEKVFFGQHWRIFRLSSWVKFLGRNAWKSSLEWEPPMRSLSTSQQTNSLQGIGSGPPPWTISQRINEEKALESLEFSSQRDFSLQLTEDMSISVIWFWTRTPQLAPSPPAEVQMIKGTRRIFWQFATACNSRRKDDLIKAIYQCWNLHDPIVAITRGISSILMMKNLHIWFKYFHVIPCF